MVVACISTWYYFTDSAIFLMKFLMSGANPHVVERGNSTALQLARNNGHTESTKALEGWAQK